MRCMPRARMGYLPQRGAGCPRDGTERVGSQFEGGGGGGGGGGAGFSYSAGYGNGI